MMILNLVKLIFLPHLLNFSGLHGQNMYLLDTNIISLLRRIDTRYCPEELTQWYNQINIEDYYLSSITIFEIEMGILLKQRKDPFQAQVLRTWFETQVKLEFFERILPVNRIGATKTASYNVPNPASLTDSLIAGTAYEYGLIVVTDNEKDFINFADIQIFNPIKRNQAFN